MSRPSSPPAVAIRPARAEDADGIVRVIRAGFEAAELDLMIYGCDGIQRFMALQIERTAVARSAYFTVADDGSGRVVGCTEVRLVPDGIYWNYLSVDPGHRAGGLGRGLIRAALWEHPGSTGTISLEVLERNVAPIAWYERMGFRSAGVTETWSLAVADDPTAPDAHLSGLPQAEIVHQAFGFSQLTVTTARGSYPVGRIGDRWFRIADPAALADPALIPALARLERRRLLAVVDRDRLAPGEVTGGELLQRTIRMTASLGTVREALGA